MKKLIFVACLLLIVIGSYKLYNTLRYKDYVSYVGDPANSCTWQDGKIDGTTQVLGFRHPIKHVKKSDEQAFLQYAAAHFECWSKV